MEIKMSKYALLIMSAAFLTSAHANLFASAEDADLILIKSDSDKSKDKGKDDKKRDVDPFAWMH